MDGRWRGRGKKRRKKHQPINPHQFYFSNLSPSLLCPSPLARATSATGCHGLNNILTSPVDALAALLACGV